MFSISTLLGQLPPPSLAETDFPRFAVRAVGRRSLSEMPRVVEALREDSLTGYPSAVAPALAVFVERLIADKIEPVGLDVERAVDLLGSPEGIEALARAITLDRSVLRPGLTVSSEIRDFLGDRLSTLPGFGGALALLSPVVVMRGHGIGFASVRSPAVARAMGSDEAQSIGAAWGALEEQTGWPSPLGHLWETRFFRVIARPNHDLDGCRALLEPMAPPARRTLWSAILEHLRDQDLPEEHRPGDRGLQRRLALAEIGASTEGLGALLDLAGWFFDRLGTSDSAVEGHLPLSSDDLAVWTSWVQVPQASRQRLGALPVEEVERVLRSLAAKQTRRAQPALEPTLARDVLAFREEYLRWRYRRDVEPLRGADPLDLIRAQREAGHDARSIVRDVQALADEVQRYCGAVREDEARRAREAAHKEAADEQAAREAALRTAADAAGEVAEASAEQEDTDEPASRPTAEPAAAGDADATEIISASARRAPKEPTPFDGLVPPKPRKPSAPLDVNPFAAEEEAAKSGGARPYDPPPPGFLPPLPIPPPRKRPTTRRFELPPLPQPPPRTTHNRPRTAEASVAPVNLVGTASADSVEIGGPRPRPSTQDSAARALARPTTVPTLGAAAAAALRAPRDTRLTTPGQATAFYEEAFRELEVFERDLLERGSLPEAERRVRELAKDADALASALGPPARSGDPTFQSALKKVELVRAYLERITPLLEGRSPAGDEAAPPTGMLGRLNRLFGRGD